MELIFVLGVFVLVIYIGYRIFTRCKHNWKVIKQGETLARSGPEFGKPNGYYYFSQCEKCGKIKREDF